MSSRLVKVQKYLLLFIHNLQNCPYNNKIIALFIQFRLYKHFLQQLNLALITLKILFNSLKDLFLVANSISIKQEVNYLIFSNIEIQNVSKHSTPILEFMLPANLLFIKSIAQLKKDYNLILEFLDKNRIIIIIGRFKKLRDHIYMS